MPHTSLRASLMTAGFAVVTLTLGPATASAQKSTSGAPGCAAVLTADEVKAAVGVAMEDMGPRDRSEGESECGWMARGAGGLKTVSVQFYDARAIKASPSASTPDAFFEMIVSAAEESTSKKREPVAGVGQRAAFVPTDPQTLAVVQRPDGIARIVANGLNKAQTVAVARAVATP
jgi:hypothetical protein